MSQASNYKQLTTSGRVKDRTGVLKGAIVLASSAGTLTVYDNTVASGTILLGPVSLTAGQVILLDDGVKASSGIYAVIGGTSATVNVLYE